MVLRAVVAQEEKGAVAGGAGGAGGGDGARAVAVEAAVVLAVVALLRMASRDAQEFVPSCPFVVCTPDVSDSATGRRERKSGWEIFHFFR